jgi:hypothetical protein
LRNIREKCGRLFLDSVEQALAAALVDAYAGWSYSVRPFRGGLGPETRNSLRIHRRDQRSQSRVNHFAPVAEFNRAAFSIAGGHQGSIGNGEEQTLLVAGSNPSFRMTREESHFASLEVHPPHGRAPRAHLDGAGPQHHGENVFVQHLEIRLSD